MENQNDELAEQTPLTLEDIQEKVVLMEQFAVGILEAFNNLNERVNEQKEITNKMLKNLTEALNSSTSVFEVVESMGKSLVEVNERMDSQEELMSNMIEEYGQLVESVSQTLDLKKD